jgi:hypothetical protein
VSCRPYYDSEFYAWTQHQAQALRALKNVGDIDLEHIAVEIEDLGQAELRAVSSALRQMFSNRRLAALVSLGGDVWECAG